MPIAQIEKQQVAGALKATGSSDPDILYARKEELLAETRRMKLLGVAPIIVGIAMCLTIIGAVVGLPAIFFGMWVRKRIKNNIRNVEEVYAEYIANLPGQARTAAV